MPDLVTPGAHSLIRILKNDCCSGCGLCASLSGGAVEMVMTASGFLRPHQGASLSAKIDGLISEVCPGLKLTRTPQEGNNHTLWGSIIETRVGASTDTALRHHASSGGALSGLLLYLLDSGVVDYVVQTAAAELDPIENMTILSRSRDEVYRAAGSRYAPSSPLGNLEQLLQKPGRFALVAKPCDIAAVQALSQYDSRVNEKIPVKLSFFCAGIPSLKGAQMILDSLGVDKTKVTRFRYRGDGWPGRAMAIMRDGRKVSMSYVESWGDILSHHVQFRCKICPDGSGGFADIVCADAWYCDDRGYPSFEEKEGRSMIISRTVSGERHVQSAIDAGYLTVDHLDIDEIEIMQPSQASRKRMVLSRISAMMMLRRGQPHFSGMNLWQAAFSGGLWPNLKSFLGMVRRLIMKG